MKLRLAGLGSVLAIVEALYCDAVLPVDLGLAVGLDLLLSRLASNLHDSSCVQ